MLCKDQIAKGCSQDSHGNQGAAQIQRARVGMYGMCGMPRGRTIPIAAGGIPLDRRHDAAVLMCLACLEPVSWRRERALECKKVGF